MAQYPMTVRGEKKLRDELHQLKSVERPQVIAAISEARAHGDLKENAEYASAREQQSFIEGRIQEIEGKLSNAVVIDITKLNQDGRVVFGTTVELADEDSGEEISYHLVGEDEANIKLGLLAYTTPIARGLIGKSEGDSVKIQTPGGVRSFEIMAVKYI